MSLAVIPKFVVESEVATLYKLKIKHNTLRHTFS
jgi:hypothetical protein